MIIKQCLSDGRELPERMQNAPQLLMGSGLYWDAFFDLSTCRPGSFGVAAIPWNVTKEYSEVYGFDAEQTESLFAIVGKMDDAFIKHQLSKRE